MEKTTQRYGRWALGGLLLAIPAILSGLLFKGWLATNERSPSGFVSVDIGLFEAEGRTDDVLATASTFAIQSLFGGLSEPVTLDPLADQAFLGEGTTFVGFVSDGSARGDEGAGVASGYPGFMGGGTEAALLAMARIAPSVALSDDTPSSGPYPGLDRHIELAPRDGPDVAHRAAMPRPSPSDGGSGPVSANAPLPQLGSLPLPQSAGAAHRDTRPPGDSKPTTFSRAVPAGDGVQTAQSPPLPKIDWGSNGLPPLPGGTTPAGITAAPAGTTAASARPPGSSGNIDQSFPRALALLDAFGSPALAEESTATDPSLQAATSNNGESVMFLDTFASLSAGLAVADPSAIPEPATLALIGLGLMAVAFSRSRSRRTREPGVVPPSQLPR